MASITSRNGRHCVRFWFDERQHRVTVGSKRKAESVRQRIEDTLADLKLQRIEIPPGVNVAEFIASGGRIPPKRTVEFVTASDDWLNTRQRHTADTTQACDRIHVGHMRRFFGSLELDRIDTRKTQQYVDHRLSRVSGETIRKELVSLRSLLNHAVKNGYAVAAVRWDEIRLPVVPRKERFQPLSKTSDGRRALLDADEVREFVAFAREHGSELLADVVTFVAFTACRRSEAIRLRSGDVDLESGTVTLTERKRKSGHVTTRTLALHTELKPVLERRLRNIQGTGPVFPIAAWELASRLRCVIAGSKYGVKGFGFHAMRHSAASRLLLCGVALPSVADVLGHSSVRTTSETYAHAFERHTASAVAML